MPKDDSGGLFSKVVKFVRNPATGWSDGDTDTDRESSYSKQMLKEMIERKRRNDFVRKREFDMLRKMRRSEVMAGTDPAARPSFFQSSLPSKPDDRASTLKKIDEIEAQMSMQWWKTKHGDAAMRAQAVSSTNFPMSSHIPPEVPPSAPVQAPATEPPMPALVPRQAYSRTEPMPLKPGLSADEPTQRMPLLDSLESVQPSPAAAPVQRAAPAAAAGPVSEPPPSSSFNASKVFAIDVDEFAHDPELEEAAIRFANGDDAGAEAGLKDVLAPGGTRVDHDETWLALFDLYRAIGQQDRFESAAIEFAGRFGRSAPQWMSMPEAVGRMGSAQAAAAPVGPSGTADWTSPSTLGTQSLAALNAALGRAQPPWRLSWTKLATIEEAALEGLTKMFSQWANQPVQLRFIGSDNLERVLKDHTPSGDKDVAMQWWKLRMEVLRVLHRPDEFELVALDYCVTYEVSPPSWDSARCEYKPLQADGSYAPGHTLIGEAFRDSLASALTGFGDTMAAGLSSQMAQVASVELAGQILGDGQEAIDLLDGKLAGADLMVISCARLIRIDFTAAGTLLNWASARQGEGRQVQFSDVHRLVAAFFNVIGISEHARVVARRD